MPANTGMKVATNGRVLAARTSPWGPHSLCPVRVVSGADRAAVGRSLCGEVLQGAA
ncbi:hypothetical protein BN11_230018 [Nostocoides australiense Ben110]|uniref:Uncharacterized protein n=1 Tax=Nostocoides australiense Ben110 TaxID=1193182 RepID=W6JVM1_9MICO|nr:hypothetical protein BN11_230018 [Tetrasphaera australiensis Ben110]